MKHTLENFFISTLGALILGTLILLFLFRSAQCHQDRKMLNEARERHRLELAWQMGFHQAYEEINTGILDTTWAQQYLDVDTILKKYK